MLPYHRLVPDDRHPLLYPVDTLRDQSEVILAHCLLGSAVGTMATASDLQVSTGKDENKVGFRPEFRLKGSPTSDTQHRLEPKASPREIVGRRF